jgi:hypothetical protein
MQIPFFTKLAGVTFGDAQENIKMFGCPDIGSYALVREDNPHDPNAIRVSLFDQHFMGYIPRDIAMELAPMMDAGRRYIAEFVCLNAVSYSDIVGMTIRVTESS